MSKLLLLFVMATSLEGYIGEKYLPIQQQHAELYKDGLVQRNGPTSTAAAKVKSSPDPDQSPKTIQSTVFYIYPLT